VAGVLWGGAAGVGRCLPRGRGRGTGAGAPERPSAQVGLGGRALSRLEVRQLRQVRVQRRHQLLHLLQQALRPAGAPDLEGRCLYEGPLSLDRTGPYGYTVRVLPTHRLLASGAELGLVAVPSEDVVEGAGVLLR